MERNKNLNPPCKGCNDRFSLCHDSCGLYKQFKTNTEAVQIARQEFLNKKSVGVESVNRYKKH
jgi:hypothetical protein